MRCQEDDNIDGNQRQRDDRQPPRGHSFVANWEQHYWGTFDLVNLGTSEVFMPESVIRLCGPAQKANELPQIFSNV